MAIDKITEWLQKLGVTIKINPTVTYHGVTVSLFEIEIDPDKWGRHDEETTAAFLRETIKTDLEEYRRALKEELKSLKGEQIESIAEEIKIYIKSNVQIELQLNEIKRLIRECPLLAVDEFRTRRTEMIHAKYETFVGREKEMEELSVFLKNPDEPIRLITGDGGTGKTRLAIEFARMVDNQEDWDVFFIKQEAGFSTPTITKDTLLIIDEPSRYNDRDKLLGFVLNRRPEDLSVKLLLLERPIFKDSTVIDLSEKRCHIEAKGLAVGEIGRFLNVYFKDIDETVIQEIEKVCEGSFLYAAFYAQHYLAEGMVGTLGEVLSGTLDKYVKDIEKATGNSSKDIKEVLEIVSLLTPLYHFDDRYLKAVFSQKQYDILDDLRQDALRKESEFLSCADGIFSIRPDIIGDYLRSELVVNDTIFRHYLDAFLPFMPSRISYNIYVLPGFKAGILEKVANILENIWKRLNIQGGATPEFFEAILLFTGDLSDLLLCDVRKADFALWIRKYHDLLSTDPKKEKEISEGLAKCLVNVTYYYGVRGDIAKMDGCLDELRALVRAHDSEELRVCLAEGFVNVTNGYGRGGDLDTVQGYLDELRGLAQAWKEKGVWNKLAQGLYNAVKWYGDKGDFEKMERRLSELITIQREHDEKEIREELAKGLVNVVAYCGMNEDAVKMEGFLGELRALKQAYGEKETACELAKGLHNTAYYYLGIKAVSVMEERLNELRDLERDHDEKDIRYELSKTLYNAVGFYTLDNNKESAQARFVEIEALGKNHPEDAVIAKLIDKLRVTVRQVGKQKKNT